MPGAGMDAQFVSFLHEMSRHGGTHDPGSDPRDSMNCARHGILVATEATASKLDGLLTTMNVMKTKHQSMMWILRWLLSLAMPLTCSAADAPDSKGMLVIVHRSSLADVAHEWGEYREATGWQTTLHEVPDETQDDDARLFIQRAIRQAHLEFSSSSDKPFMVLLLGDAEGTDGLPTWHHEQFDETIRSSRDSRYATDHQYQLADDNDHLPGFALGRVPVRSLADARTVLEKIRRFEAEQLIQPAPNRVEMMAGEGRFGPLDRLLEWMFHQMVDRLVPLEYDLRVAYAHPNSVYCPPPDELNSYVKNSMVSDAVFFNYIGHGGPTGLDQLIWTGGETRMLSVNDFTELPPPTRQPGPAFLNCCSTGWFDLGEQRTSLGEAMLRSPKGPIAVIAGSRMTHPYANALMQKNFIRAMLFDRASTIGEVDLQTTRSLMQRDALDRQIDAIAGPLARLMSWPASLHAHRAMHMELYNLLGDPSTQLPQPRGTIEDLSFNNSTLSFVVPRLATGEARVVIESARDSFAAPDALAELASRNDPAFLEKVAQNFPVAQQRTLWEKTITVDDSRVQIELPNPLPPNAAIIRVMVVGRDGKEQLLDAFSAIEVPRPPVPAKRLPGTTS